MLTKASAGDLKGQRVELRFCSATGVRRHEDDSRLLQL